jgi:uncharacterized SAM-binding protein YcdF (DUF218 family)
MNALLSALHLGALKGLLTALLLPPLPLLLLAAWGGWALWRGRRRRGGAGLAVALLGLWLCTTTALGDVLMRTLVPSPPALAPADVQRLTGAPHTAILVLGAGIHREALEYRAASLKPLTLERLHYGLWLARRTGLPVGYTGGPGYGRDGEVSEAEVATRVAAEDFGQPLRWREARSRDTHENADFSVPLLQADGITRIVLVTHGFHQRRALRNFERAVQASGAAITLVPAPVGLRPPATFDEWADWLPTREGFVLVHLALHEWLGWVAGA